MIKKIYQKNSSGSLKEENRSLRTSAASVAIFLKRVPLSGCLNVVMHHSEP
ncbi:MAG: hypothetical protein IJR46_00575 [Neisseriaceae bacterium]|nr:hypothetical protein [Neisseriaceae bacterium]